MMITDAFLKEIPKTDVHLHLDGSLRLTTLIELAQKNNVALPFYDEENLRNAVFPDHYEDLPSYLRQNHFRTQPVVRVYPYSVE